MSATGLLLLLAGMALGGVLTHFLHPALRQQREGSQREQASQQQLRDYQAQVAEHFTETAELLNRMTASYREVHNHLARGAQQLCGEGAGRHLLARSPVHELDYVQPELDTEALAKSELRPPLDYAPRTPNAPGQLSEGFGLEKAGER